MIEPPTSYIEYLKSGAPTFGETDLEWAGYFDLEPLDKIEELNRDIEIEKYAPGFIAFASDGGGDVYVFDESGTIYTMPLIGMESKAAIKVADSWEHFLSHVQPT